MNLNSGEKNMLNDTKWRIDQFAYVDKILLYHKRIIISHSMEIIIFDKTQNVENSNIIVRPDVEENLSMEQPTKI